MFMIISVGAAVLAFLSVAGVLIVIVVMKREDRTRTSVHHAPRTASTALARRVLGLYVIDPPQPHTVRR
ncbi:hypothetical protein J5X84_35850 [Streptosporangiaceae bacterium NEAU-GS5]|nr:hypothetical protein [Streptosporangiaceae bacterium NEAU-GS5]